MDIELDLLSEGKEGKGGGLAARVTVNSLCSQPVDQKHMFGDPSDRVADFSDEDEEFASSQDEGEGEVEGSDSEPMLDDSGRRVRKTQRVKIPANARVIILLTLSSSFIHALFTRRKVVTFYMQEFATANRHPPFISSVYGCCANILKNSSSPLYSLRLLS